MNLIILQPLVLTFFPGLIIQVREQISLLLVLVLGLPLSTIVGGSFQLWHLVTFSLFLLPLWVLHSPVILLGLSAPLCSPLNNIPL